jgi:hypothetical protein
LYAGFGRSAIHTHCGDISFETVGDFSYFHKRIYQPKKKPMYFGHGLGGWQLTINRQCRV